MPFWRLESNFDGSFSLYEDPMGELEANAGLSIALVAGLAALISPVFANPGAFLPSLTCFLLALVFRFFFCGNNFYFLCPLFIPLAAYSFVCFSEAAIVNEQGEMVLVAFPAIVGAAILFGLLTLRFMDEDSEFGMAMVLLFGLPLGIATPLAGSGIGDGTVVFYTLRVLYIFTAVLVIRALVMFIREVASGALSFGGIVENLVMFAVGCGVYIAMAVLGAIFGELSGLLCIALFALITVFYSTLYKRILHKPDVDNGSRRFIYLPALLIAIINCFIGAQFTVKDDLFYPLSELAGQLHLLPWLAGLGDRLAESFAVLFAGAVELFLRLIETVFDCSIGTPHLPDFAGMLLGTVALGVTMTITDKSLAGAKRRREYKRKLAKK